MGFTGAPERAPVRAARTRFLDALGLDAAAAAAAIQVHGTRVLRIGAGERGRGGLDPGAAAGEADGLVTTERRLPLLALAADCAVAVLASRDGRAAGVVHAGWRGAAARAPGAGVRAFRELLGVEARGLRAVLAPAAGPCCYEAGEEVREAFRASFGGASGPWFLPGPHGRPRLDLPAAVRAGLVEAGVDASSIGPPGPCTICGEAWFSHRRRDAGRQAVVVAIL